MSNTEVQYQCEDCGSPVDESDADIHWYPGYDGRVTIALCPGCA